MLLWLLFTVIIAGTGCFLFFFFVKWKRRRLTLSPVGAGNGSFILDAFTSGLSSSGHMFNMRRQVDPLSSSGGGRRGIRYWLAVALPSDVVGPLLLLVSCRVWALFCPSLLFLRGEGGALPSPPPPSPPLRCRRILAAIASASSSPDSSTSLPEFDWLFRFPSSPTCSSETGNIY